MADGAALGLLTAVKQAVSGLYGDITAKLTADRAQKLDNLPDLTGPVAAQANLGLAPDLAAMNGSLFGDLNLISSQLTAIDGELRVINAAQQTVFTGAVPNSQLFTNASGLIVPLSTDANGAISWNLLQYGSKITSVKYFTPSFISQHLIPGASGTGVPPVALQWLLTGDTPGTTGVLASLLATTGQLQGGTEPTPPYQVAYTPSLGQLTLSWTGAAYTLTAANGTTATTVQLGASIYPLTVRWTPGHGLVATPNGGSPVTIADGYLPSVTAQLSLALWTASGLSLIAIGYV